MGYAPFAPGSVASAVLLAAVWFAAPQPVMGWQALGWGAGLLPLAIWAAGRLSAMRGVKDPSIVVVDEVVGQLVTLVGVRSGNWVELAWAFALFRLYDIWKPWPVRQLEALPGGVGIVLDDAMAGLYAAATLYLLVYGWKG